MCVEAGAPLASVPNVMSLAKALALRSVPVLLIAITLSGCAIPLREGVGPHEHTSRNDRIVLVAADENRLLAWNALASRET